MATLDDKAKKEVSQKFDEVVNMSTAQLESWLKTNESKSVGQVKEGESESIGHKSGNRIIEILDKKAGDLTATDYAHMEKVVSYVKRHSAQRPEQVADSNWEYSLKNWGHDPSRK